MFGTKGSRRGSSVVEALVAITLLTLTSVMVFQAAHLANAATIADASRRQVQDLVFAKTEAWKQGSSLVLEEGTLAAGAAYRFTPETASSNGVEQLRIEVIWSYADPLPVSSANWPLRVTGIAARLP